MRARLLTPTILGAIVIGAIAAIGIVGTIGIVGMIGLTSKVGADEAVPLAAPKPLNQTGFPHELYGWVTPADNPQTPPKVALGKELFFDHRLSADNTLSLRQLPRARTRASPISCRPRWGFTSSSGSATRRPS